MAIKLLPSPPPPPRLSTVLPPISTHKSSPTTHVQAQSVVHALTHGSDARVIFAVPGHLLQQFPHSFHQVIHRLEVRAAAVQDAWARRARLS